MARARLLAALCGCLLFALLPLGGANAAFFGTNGLVAYDCGSSICVVNPGSGSTTLIANAASPAWSPDGSKLAYVTSTGDLQVQAISGGAVSGSPITVVPSIAAQPTWSPNNTQIAYVNTAANTIYVTSATANAGAGQQVLTTPAGGERDPAWSPTGTQLAYARSTSGHFQLYTANLAGNGREASGDTPAPLTTTTVGDNRNPNWSPDGGTLAFSSTKDGLGYPVLYTIPAGGGGLTLVGTGGNPTPGDAPAFSPDGNKLVFVVPAGAPSNAGTLWTIGADGSSKTEIDSGTTDGHPDWQPVAFSSGGGGGGGSTSGPPVNATYPVISLPLGSSSTGPTVGTTLVASTGTWNGSVPMTFTYQWKQCDPTDPVNGPCYAIAGATSSFFVVPWSAYKMRIRVAVTATNASGSVAQNSEVSAVVSAIAPHLRATPPIVGQNMVGQTLSVGTGTWDGSTPLTYSYSWRRCDPYGTPPSCVAIPGATSSTYVPTVEDIGTAIRAYITATNPAGSETDFTNHTFPILDKPHFAPTATTNPTISPTTAFGIPATATLGVYSGDQPITTSLRWWRCDATGASCHAIAAAKGLVYTPGQADIGYTLRVSVTAKNAYGTLVAQSDPSEPIAAPWPHARGARIVARPGQDYIVGTHRDDVIRGNRLNDYIDGNGGYDVIYGGPGNDVIRVPGPGSSKVFAGPGSDTIYAANGYRDVIDCGPGNDRAVVDAFDVVKNCEVVVRKP